VYLSYIQRICLSSKILQYFKIYLTTDKITLIAHKANKRIERTILLIRRPLCDDIKFETMAEKLKKPGIAGPLKKVEEAGVGYVIG
jgi:hypothetical protein